MAAPPRPRTRRTRRIAPGRDCDGRGASSPEGLGCVLRWPFICLSFARPSRESPRPSQPFGFSPPRRTRTGPSARHELLHLPFTLVRYSRTERSCIAPFMWRVYRPSRAERSYAVPFVSCISPFKSRTVLIGGNMTRPFCILRSESSTAQSNNHKIVLLLKSKIVRQMNGKVFCVPRQRAFVSGGRVRPEGPKERGGALRACSKMRGGPVFHVG